MDSIEIIGAKQNNLKNITIAIPKGKLVAVTGLSGSGKSSLVFETIYAESFRRFAEVSQMPVHLMGGLGMQMQRPVVKQLKGLPPALGLSQRQGVAGKLSTVGTITGVVDLFRVYFAAYGESYCRSCLTPLQASDPQKILDKVMTEASGARLEVLAFVVEKRKGSFVNELTKLQQKGFTKIYIDHELIDLDENDVQLDAKKLHTIKVQVDKFSLDEKRRGRLEKALFHAAEIGKGIIEIQGLFPNKPYFTFKFNLKASCPTCGATAPKLDPRHLSHSSLGKCFRCEGTGCENEEISADIMPCSACHGSRLSVSLPLVKINETSFEDLQQARISFLEKFVTEELRKDANGLLGKRGIVDELSRILFTLNRLSLGHLTLGRSGSSLAPGDLQRLRLASMLSNRLHGALYILDEPCQGLTKQEVQNLVELLRDHLSNHASVLAVEHHPEFLRQSDEVFTLGPGAGVHGGQIIGHVRGALVSKEFAVKKEIGIAKKSRTSLGVPQLVIEKSFARQIHFPKREFFQGKTHIFHGFSGRGKQTYVELCLLPILQGILEKKKPKFYPNVSCDFVAQKLTVEHLLEAHPGSLSRQSRRSIISTIDALNLVRKLYAALPLSQTMGLSEMSFSWHSTAGQCSHCKGKGYFEIQQRFGPPIENTCEVCFGQKLQARSLLPKYKSKNLIELLDLTVEESLEFFLHHRLIHQRLSRLEKFGLGYLKLGQTLDSLSGGELQRLTLTQQLSRQTLGGSWYVLHHPGTGLHKPDILALGNLLRQMNEQGATFILLENREEFMGFADVTYDFNKPQ